MADTDHSLKLLTFNERCRWEAWRDPARIKPGLVRNIIHEQAWAPDVDVEIIPLLDRLAAGRIVAQRDGRDLATRFWGYILAEARRLQQVAYLGLGSFKLVMMIEERTRGALIPTETEAARAPEPGPRPGLEPQLEEPGQAPEQAEPESETAPVDALAEQPLRPGVSPPPAALIDTMAGNMARLLWADHSGVQPDPKKLSRLEVEKAFRREHLDFAYKGQSDRVSSTFEQAIRMLGWRWR